MAKIFCTKTIDYSSLNALKDAGHQIEMWDDLNKGPIDKTELLKEAKNADALITMLSDVIDREFLLRNKHLKVIAQYAVGTNNIDIQTATELEIVITNTPDVLTHATAELAFALLLSSARNIPQAIDNAKNGEWKGWEPLAFRGPSLLNSKVGIIGAGRIGRSFAEMCRGAFSSEIYYYSRSEKLDFKALKVDLKTLFKECDVISLHCPLTQETKEMIDSEILEYASENQILINTARGEIINQEHLVTALRAGKFHGVGLDVTTPEPLPKDHILYSFNNVHIIPHIGSASFEARREMGNLVAKNINAVLENLAAPTQVTS